MLRNPRGATGTAEPPPSRTGRSRPRFMLGPDCYRDPAWLDRELRGVFERTWALVAAADELPRGGAPIEATIGRVDVAVARLGDGSIVAWRGDIAVSSAEWQGMVFVHLDPAAPPFAEFLGSWPDHLGSFQPGALRQVARQRIEGRFNWKLFVENHVDVLHLWYLHDRSLADFDHARFDHRHVGGHWTSYEPYKAAVLASLGAGPARAGHIGHLADRDRFGIGAHMIFPNILIASTAEFWITYAATPLSPSRSAIDLRVRAEPDADPEALVAAARSFIDEDVAACEAIQIVVPSARFEVGPLASEHEAPISHFHEHLLAALGETP